MTNIETQAIEAWRLCRLVRIGGPKAKIDAIGHLRRFKTDIPAIRRMISFVVTPRSLDGGSAA